MTPTQMRFPALAAAVLLAAAGTAAAQSSQSSKITNDHRLFHRFVEDGAVVENLWLEGQFRWESFDDSDVVSLTPVFAATLAEDFELGGRVGILSVDPEDGTTESGFSDLDIWGKIRLTTKPTQLSVGLLLKLPTGDEDKSLRLGTGEMDVEFFAGLRHDFESASLIANAIFRVNQDPDVGDQDVLDSLGLKGQDEAEGEPSLGLGGGLLFSMTRQLSGILEVSYETERINDLGSDFRVMLGADYRSGDAFGFRGGLTGGAGDSAPELGVIGTAYLLF